MIFGQEISNDIIFDNNQVYKLKMQRFYVFEVNLYQAILESVKLSPILMIKKIFKYYTKKEMK